MMKQMYFIVNNQSCVGSTLFWYVHTIDLVGCCVGFYLTWYETSGSQTFDREAFLPWSCSIEKVP